MKFIIGMLVVVSFSTNVLAQNATNNVVDVTPQQQGQIEVINEPITTQTVTTRVEQSPVVIQNQPSISVQRQSTTIVEDSPLSESSADRLRRQRVNLEQKVESKIVEKLEHDRMKSEQERLEKLFNDKGEQKVEVNQLVVEPAVIAPVQVVNPQPSVSPIVEQNINSKVIETIEVKTELAEVKEQKAKGSSTTVGLDLGFLTYNSADNVDSAGTMGLSVGFETEERIIIEGNFRYARADVEAVNRPYAYSFYNPSTIYPTITEMQQYNFGGSLKYRILDNKISPVIGGLVSYVYRDYQDKQVYDYKLTAQSTSFDVGLIVGADIKLTNKLKITGEYSYVMNMTYDITLDNNRLEPSRMWGDSLSQPLEEIGYSNFIVSLKYIF